MATPLQYTPRKFVIHPQSNNLVIIESDHNAFTDKVKDEKKQQIAEVCNSGNAVVKCLATDVLSPGQTIATCQRSISQHCLAQHVVCVWPPCCDVLGVVGSSLKMGKFEPTIPNMSEQIASRWPNAHNMLRSTMLRYVALACSDRLVGASRLYCFSSYLFDLLTPRFINSH